MGGGGNRGNLWIEYRPQTMSFNEKPAVLQAVEDYQLNNDHESLNKYLFKVFSRIDELLKAFKMPIAICGSNSTIDCDLVEKIYSKLSDGEVEAVDTVVHAQSTLIERIMDKETILETSELGVYVIILMNPYLQYPEHQTLILPRLCGLLMALSKLERLEFQSITNDSIKSTRDITLMRSSQNSDTPSAQAINHFQTILAVLQMFINIKILTKSDEEPASKDEDVIKAAQTLEIFYVLNEIGKFVPYYDFYNETIESSIDMKEDYPKWKGKEGFSFCDCPFLLGTSAKAEILKVECLVHMRHELQDTFFRALFIGVNSPYLQLEVRRNHAIRDTLFQLEGKTTHELRKQLRVSFVGEEGIDEGGVQKEFFQIIVKEMFDANYGMFYLQDDSRLYWFANDHVNDIENIQEYNLIGRMIGLAIYNGVILDISFPLALYKKILNYPLELTDLKEIDPMLGRGLEQLLQFDGDVYEAFQRTFEVEYSTPSGERLTLELKEDGANIPVTEKNRREFVKAYVDFYFNTSCEKQFNAFFSGFNHVMEGSALSIFRPEELQELVCGSVQLDFKALETVTQYDGYEKDSQTIKDFWEIVHEMSEEEKKQLLFFTTGSDRVPIGGLSKLSFVIARNGTDSDRLPTSHTCYNVLLLSEYASKEKLKDRLGKALSNSNCGFFLN